MKVTAQTAELQDALLLVGSIVQSRTPKPVLQCVKLIAEGDVLTLMATDLEAGCRCQVTAVRVEEPGEALIPAAKLTGIVRECSDENELKLEVDKDACVVRSAAGHFKVFGYDPAEYPAVADFQEPADLTVGTEALAEMIGKTLFATAKTHSHYAMAGVLLEATGKKISLVATDGHRLAQARGSLKAAAERDLSAIVPTKLMSLIQRVAGDADDQQLLEIKLLDNQILVRSPRAVLVSSLVQGNFPKYSDVIPKDCAMKATIDGRQFEHRIRQAALLTDEESRSVKLSFSEGRVTLTSRTPDAGEAEVVCPASYSGESIELGFTPSFLTDALKVVDAEQISFEMNANNKPALLRCGQDFLYALMPLDPG